MDTSSLMSGEGKPPAASRSRPAPFLDSTTPSKLLKTPIIRGFSNWRDPTAPAERKCYTGQRESAFIHTFSSPRTRQQFRLDLHAHDARQYWTTSSPVILPQFVTSTLMRRLTAHGERAFGEADGDDHGPAACAIAAYGITR